MKKAIYKTNTKNGMGYVVMENCHNVFNYKYIFLSLCVIWEYRLVYAFRLKKSENVPQIKKNGQCILGQMAKGCCRCDQN